MYTHLGHFDDALDLVVKGYGTMMRIGRECVKEKNVFCRSQRCGQKLLVLWGQ